MMAIQNEMDFSRPAVEQCPVCADQEFRRIHAYLVSHCSGRQNMRTAARIARDLEIGPHDGRRVRSLISLYQDTADELICGEPGHGYFITLDPSELSHYHRTLFSTLQAIGIRIAKFRRAAKRAGFFLSGSGSSATWTRPFEPASMPGRTPLNPAQ